MPKVTAIVPNYNHARFLEQRLDTVLSQTYKDVEVLYLDDASTDSSAEVFSRYSQLEQVRAIVNEQNSGGPFPQWNRGVREARGEYIWIAEADDFADERLLERLVPLLEANDNIGIAYCDSRYVDENGITGELATPQRDTEHWKSDFTNSGIDECARYLLYGCTIPNASAVLFRKRVFVEAGYADESMKLCGDWLLWARMLMRSDIAFIAEPLNFFRQHSRSVSRRTGVATFVLEKYRIVCEILSAAPVPDLEREQSLDDMASYWVYNMLHSPRTIPMSSFGRVYRVAKDVDKKIGRRLIRKIGAYYLWRIGIMDRLRSAKKALRPNAVGSR